MKVVIVTNSSSYEPRAEKTGAFLEKNGHQVLWIETDFLHREKRKGRLPKKDHVYLDTISYKKNLSVRRLYSQYDFARKAERFLRGQEIDLLYVMIPANSLARAAARIKKMSHAKLVFDIIDLWPESLPVKGLERFWPVQYWRRLRDDHLGAADLILTECEMYQSRLKMGGTDRATLYWPKEQNPKKRSVMLDNSAIHIVYLGSINHIIDIGEIAALLSCVDRKKKVMLHVIGDGERREEFLTALKQKGIQTEYHGSIYEEDEKAAIFSKCSFGINMMKPDVCVGLTMKSVDYFCYGLPIINNIKGDTWKLVEDYGIGVNLEPGSYEAAAQSIIEFPAQQEEMSRRIQELYQEKFTDEAFYSVLKDKILPLLQPERI